MNTQITEDYISFEVAKLLKEKGFDELTCGFYHDDYMGKLLVSNPSNHNGSINSIAAPSQAHVMKWLREVHNLWIDIDPLTGNKWTWSIWFMNDPTQKMGESLQSISNYKEACEAAIKYCLTYLI